jgi:predicted molibdopterin-dependent oxidoreductase YjgC
MRLFIDDRAIDAPEGATLLSAARDHDIQIPTLCHHPALKPAGACRVCAVEMLRDAPKSSIVVLACATKVKEGMRIRTTGKVVHEARTTAFQRMAAMAPASRRIRDMADQEGIALPPIPNGCILCRLCVRVCQQVVGRDALTIVATRDGQQVVPVPGRCIGCGTCANLCPTQVITVSDEYNVRTIRLHGEIIGRHPLERCQGCGQFYASVQQIQLTDRRTAPHPPLKHPHKYCPTCAKLFSDRLEVVKQRPPAIRWDQEKQDH